MILPRRCLAVSGLDLGLDAARAAFTALAAAEERISEKEQSYKYEETWFGGKAVQLVETDR